MSKSIKFTRIRNGVPTVIIFSGRKYVLEEEKEDGKIKRIRSAKSKSADRNVESEGKG